MRKLFFFVLFGVSLLQASAQVEVETPLVGNPFIRQYLDAHPDYVWKPGRHASRSFTDTLNLPFFDDFTNPEPWPDPKKWADNTVYINATFGVEPPSYGMATFDNLDRYGNPYRGIQPNLRSTCDTLTSQAIDLSQLTPKDSIILSFYVQPQGLDVDSLDPEDSLVVSGMNANGAWVSLRKIKGSSYRPFVRISIPLNDSLYFHKGFRFRFMNYALQTGATNHWHVDYVLLDKSRSVNELPYQDNAIMYPPCSFLKNYQSMPWRQMMCNPQKELVDSHSVGIRNNYINIEQVKYWFDLYAPDGSGLDSENGILGRINPESNDSILFATTAFYNQITTADTIRIRRKYQISVTGDKVFQNDTISRVQEFSNYIAYDDGTAETGYGLKVSPGKVALGFDICRPDTLRAISLYFNQSAQDVKGKSITLMVWKSITPGSNKDVVLKKQYVLLLGDTIYTNAVNGFSTIYLDTPVAVDGKFYIGWQQTTAFMANIGFDKNYKIDDAYAINPNLYYNVAGSWESTLLKGTPMLRPHLGDKPISRPLGVQPLRSLAEINQAVTVYPNPTHDEVQWVGLPYTQESYRYVVFDGLGRVVANDVLLNNTLSLRQFPPAVYRVVITDKSGNWVCTKSVVVIE